MDVNGISYHSFENHSSRGLDTLNSEKMPAVRDDFDTLYINYAAIAWHEMRRAWRGDQSVASQRKPIEQTKSWCTSYKDLLSSKEPFDGPIPLAKMVEFLVEVWGESS